MTVSEYIKRKYAVVYGTYIRKEGKGFYLVDGKLVEEKEHHANNKLPTSLNSSGQNADKTKIYLY